MALPWGSWLAPATRYLRGRGVRSLPGKMRVIREGGHRIDWRLHQLLRVLILAEVGQHVQIWLQTVWWPVLAEDGRRRRANQRRLDAVNAVIKLVTIQGSRSTTSRCSLS